MRTELLQKLYCTIVVVGRDLYVARVKVNCFCGDYTVHSPPFVEATDGHERAAIVELTVHAVCINRDPFLLSRSVVPRYKQSGLITVLLVIQRNLPRDFQSTV